MSDTFTRIYETPLQKICQDNRIDLLLNGLQNEGKKRVAKEAEALDAKIPILFDRCITNIIQAVFTLDLHQEISPQEVELLFDAISHLSQAISNGDMRKVLKELQEDLSRRAWK